MFLIRLWNYQFRMRNSPCEHKTSHAAAVTPEELAEEFDTFSTSHPKDLVRIRYDWLRSVAEKIQLLLAT
ncbi:Phosphoribosyltransferase C-terminal [Trema orientale]|uniref:Phosphoribosyltransferase C-terminal n=1 Tax=Trema orientale TaxID=63057 RepID=A0A2P5CTE0_TREOI|nr:Phosphoribosyltransferase C-terminal [Trema orientale]